MAAGSPGIGEKWASLQGKITKSYRVCNFLKDEKTAWQSRFCRF
ncbi:hypothetical protein HMPREF0262_01471 [Clostridium sp. ATCC 29733]|nr:hypothetical protein HMPREF0262_01471 [Clostridium sp. ATCC 29733]